MGAFKNAIVGASLASLAFGHSIHEKRGTVPVDGNIITQCVTPGAVALTFDDGPFDFTQKIVDLLTAAGHKATFFQNGNNYAPIANYAGVLQSMIAGGHQVASHTWSHKDLATLTADEIKEEMNLLEAAHLSIIGKAPTYMRPPFLSTNALALTTLKGLGYKIIGVDIDTQDWAEGPIGQIQLSIDWFKGNLTNGGSISLNHDPYQPTADTFVPAIIEYLNSAGLKSVTVGECLGDDAANWYRGGSVSSSSAPASSSASKASSSAPSGSASASSYPSGSSAASVPSGYPSGSAPHGSASSGPGYPTGSAPHGSGGAGYPTGTPYPSGGSGSGSGSGSGWGSGSGSGSYKPVKGGDTEPGHGADAGRGAMPGWKGQGNYGSSGNSTGSVAGSVAGSGSKTNSTGSAASPSTSYYVSGASGLTASGLIIGLAALAFLL